MEIQSEQVDGVMPTTTAPAEEGQSIARNSRLAAYLAAALAAAPMVGGCGNCDTSPVSSAEVEDALDFLDMERAADCIDAGEFQAGEYVNGEEDAFGNPNWTAYFVNRPEITCPGISVDGSVVSYAGEFYDADLTVTTDDVTYQVGEGEEYGPFQGNEELQSLLLMDNMVGETHPMTFWYYDTASSTVWGAASMVPTDCEQINDSEILCDTEEVPVELE